MYYVLQDCLSFLDMDTIKSLGKQSDLWFGENVKKIKQLKNLLKRKLLRLLVKTRKLLRIFNGTILRIYKGNILAIFNGTIL